MPHILALTLLLNIHNLAAVPASVIRTAHDEVVRLFDAIGVRIDTADAADTDPSVSLDVILIPDATGDLRRERDSVMGATVWTFKGTPVVYVFYRRVQSESERYAASTVLVLACTLAHELGHVLLADRGHAAEGLMRPSWNRDDLLRAEQGRLRFLPEDAARIRARLLETTVEQ